MSKRQRRQSTVDTPGPTTKRKVTQFFHQTTAKINDGVVEPVRHADPGGSDVEFPDRELLSPASPAGDECSAEQTVTLVTSPTLSDVPLNLVHPPQRLALYQTLVTC